MFCSSLCFLINALNIMFFFMNHFLNKQVSSVVDNTEVYYRQKGIIITG